MNNREPALQRFRRELSPVLSKVKAPNYLTPDVYKGSRNLNSFALNFLMTTSLAIEQYKRDVVEHGENAKQPRFVLVFNSLPGSGKTYYGGMVERFVQEWLAETFPGVKKTDLFAKRTWETDGKLAAFNAGEVITPLNKPANPVELFASTRYLAEGILNSVNRAFITFVETPGGVAILKNPELEDNVEGWDGKMFGNKAIRDLSLGRGIFSGAKSKYNFELHVAGLTAGRLLGLRQDFRAEIKAVSSIGEAKKICSLFGVAPPADREELEIMKFDGATPEQILGTVREARRLMDNLGLGLSFEERARFRAEYEHDVRSLQTGIGLNRPLLALAQHEEGLLLARVFKKDYLLPDEVTCIGANDPDLAALRVKAWRLRNYYVKHGFQDISGRQTNP